MKAMNANAGDKLRMPQICTYCPKPASTRDHVFPTCLFLKPSNERSIKVPSCEGCNCKSQEALLKSLFSVFNRDLAKIRAKELKHVKGKGDKQRFLRTVSERNGNAYAYIDDELTGLFKKMFMGLRRHLLKEAWTFVEKDSVALFVVEKAGPAYILRNLPLKVGGPCEGYVSPDEFVPLYESYEHTFRDFSFSLYRDAVMALKYNVRWTGQELMLAALFLPDFQKWHESFTAESQPSGE